MTIHDAIWALNAGDTLEARRTLYLEGGNQERVFTAGKQYPVLRILPIRLPAAAVVIDDSGQENKIEAYFLDNFIHRARA